MENLTLFHMWMQLPPETNKHDVDGFGPGTNVRIDTAWKETPCSLQARDILGVEEGGRK